jgi:D-3-phosphoglycerate dehydrogenase
MTKLKGLILGDAMIPSEGFRKAFEKYLGAYGETVFAGDWEPSWDQLQFRRLEVEKNGPEIEPADPLVLEYGKGANLLMGLFVPVSSKVMEAMPNLKVVGVSRAGLENVNVEEATKRGILVFNVMGRNAHAVSDFTVGMMLAEARNIARAHYAIKNGEWRKTFANSDHVPELNGKTVGLFGFGYIGQLVAKKLTGFDSNVVVYDPYVDDDTLNEHNVKRAELEELFEISDFISVHARLTEENKGIINADLFSKMKPTAYFINTGRAGLVDQAALVQVLKDGKIMGAALDVFTTEPIPADSPYLELDNVTLTTHIAGTTSDALNNSPYLLAADIAELFNGKKPKFIINPEVLDQPAFSEWLASVRG